MPIENWSDRVVVARLGDDPQLTEDLLQLDQATGPTHRDVVIDFAAVHYLNSSHIGRLLKLRKKIITDDHKLVLCGVKSQVWGAFMVTNLDTVFQFADDVATALATLQIAQ